MWVAENGVPFLFLYERSGTFFMSTLEEHKKIVNFLNSQVGNEPSYDLLMKYYSEAHYILEDLPDRRDLAFNVMDFVLAWTDKLWKYVDDDFHKLYWKAHLFKARNMWLDSYLLYLEKKREYKDRYYEPRRKCFLKIGLIQALQEMLDDKIDILTISMPPGTGKTTLEEFFHSGLCGWFPKDANLFYSHSGDITRMYYDGMEHILTDADEYTWGEIFTDLKVTSTNAKLEQINVGKHSAFANIQCTSVGAKNSGKVRVSENGYLLCDDLIGGIEEALNKNRLDGLWNIYAVDARQRKKDGAKEIHIATRWSVHDVIGRLQRAYEGNERCKFVSVPDIDPDTGESNFMFDVNPFTVKFYNDQEKIMDEVSYKCLYKNEPIEREGLLIPEDKLRRYMQLPQREPDEIIGQCDTKGKGTDYFVLPVLYRYGDDYYCEDAICSNDTDYELQYERSASILVNHKVQSCDFERNAGGDRVAMEVDKRVKEKGWICNITDTPTETNKEAKIFQCSNWIMQHILFKDKSQYSNKSDYAELIRELCTYSATGKNKHDDVPDCLATFAIRVTGAAKASVVTLTNNPFWRR